MRPTWASLITSLTPLSPALFERDHELAPETLAFAVADLEAEQLTAAVSIDLHGHDHSPGADLHRLAQAAVEVGGIQIHVGVTALQRPVQEGLLLHVDLGADAADQGPGDTALHAQGRHQGIDLAGGDAADVRLHHDAVEGLIHAASGLENRGQVAARAQLGDHQVDVADLGRQVPRPVAIAVVEPSVTALVALGAEYSSNLELDQLLEPAFGPPGAYAPGGSSTGSSSMNTPTSSHKAWINKGGHVTVIMLPRPPCRRTPAASGDTSLRHPDEVADHYDNFALDEQRLVGLRLADDGLRPMPGPFHGEASDRVLLADDSLSPLTKFRGPRQEHTRIIYLFCMQDFLSHTYENLSCRPSIGYSAQWHVHMNHLFCSLLLQASPIVALTPS